jgi:hypothetical protein
MYGYRSHSASRGGRGIAHAGLTGIYPASRALIALAAYGVAAPRFSPAGSGPAQNPR